MLAISSSSMNLIDTNLFLLESLAYVMAATHGLDEQAEQLKEMLDDKVDILFIDLRSLILFYQTFTFSRFLKSMLTQN